MVSIEKAISYYRKSGMKVDGSHFLTRLVYSFIFSSSEDYTSIYSTISDSKDELAQGAGITTAINSNSPFDSVFYPSCQEYVIATSDLQYKDTLNMVEEDWITLEPLKVVRHPYRLLGTHYPVGFGKGHDYSVISVDIPALAIMYSGWVKYNNKLVKENPDYTRETIEQFLGSYVLPNMLYSQFNCTILNMISNISGEWHEDLYQSKLGMHVTTYESKIEKELSGLLDRITVMDIPPEACLSNIPSIRESVSILDGMATISASDTQANYTVLVLASLQLVEASLFLSSSYSNLTKYRNTLKKIYRRIRNVGVLRKIEDRILRDKIEATLGRIELWVQ
jgi:hypothetical protein